jgi:hypothetical protein
MRITKTSAAVALGVGALAIAGAAIALCMQIQHGMQPPNLTSKSKSITLKDASSPLKLRDGMQLAGNYQPRKDQSLFYAVTDAKNAMVASGSMLAESGSFSRNLTFDSKVSKGDKLTLKLYTQSKKGQRLDELSVPAQVE